MEQYEYLLKGNGKVGFGTRNTKLDLELVPEVYEKMRGNNILVLDEINEFHRHYIWV